ncbi:hypothetical protein HYPSUDRAFT_818367 [Hypholoma sublateritium FD-334 SS-4]|uniref:Uncharacterized protein n=1 Tax=Hypholoma sublateritium (strain FD-334 SS-4) TaxID=945553 RepID=A0A0D2NV20_HYPSF|nr:hypothetical protein HYPSUDRAFT_818367 [Hypholoma sublateritium FD-334 SS-4]
MLFSSPKMPSMCAACLQVDVADVHISLAALTSVVDVDDDTFQFLHASLPDFLLDPERAQAFYIDPITWNCRLAILAYQGMAKEGTHSTIFIWVYYMNFWQMLAVIRFSLCTILVNLLRIATGVAVPNLEMPPFQSIHAVRKSQNPTKFTLPVSFVDMSMPYTTWYVLQRYAWSRCSSLFLTLYT